MSTPVCQSAGNPVGPSAPQGRKRRPVSSFPVVRDPVVGHRQAVAICHEHGMPRIGDEAKALGMNPGTFAGLFRRSLRHTPSVLAGPVPAARILVSVSGSTRQKISGCGRGFLPCSRFRVPRGNACGAPRRGDLALRPGHPSRQGEAVAQGRPRLVRWGAMGGFRRLGCGSALGPAQGATPRCRRGRRGLWRPRAVGRHSGMRRGSSGPTACGAVCIHAGKS